MPAEFGIPGIGAIGNMPWGAHFCRFYETKQDLLDTAQSPYKEAWTVEEAVAEIRRQEARQFDPAVVEAFLRIHARPEIPS